MLSAFLKATEPSERALRWKEHMIMRQVGVFN